MHQPNLQGTIINSQTDAQTDETFVLTPSNLQAAIKDFKMILLFHVQQRKKARFIF